MCLYNSKRATRLNGTRIREESIEQKAVGSSQYHDTAAEEFDSKEKESIRTS